MTIAELKAELARLEKEGLEDTPAYEAVLREGRRRYGMNVYPRRKRHVK